MFGLTGLSKQQRFVLGIFVLLIVDIIWVASSELTRVSPLCFINEPLNNKINNLGLKLCTCAFSMFIIKDQYDIPFSYMLFNEL